MAFLSRLDVSLLSWSLDGKVKAELLVGYQVVAEYHRGNGDPIVVDIEGGGPGAAQAVEVPQAHSRSTEGKAQHVFSVFCAEDSPRA